MNAVLQCRQQTVARPLFRYANDAEQEKQQRGSNDDDFPTQILIHEE
jgi:hypothetical protein